MNDARDGLVTLLKAVSTAPLNTFSVAAGYPLWPVTRAGKTSGRYAWVFVARGERLTYGAGDARSVEGGTLILYVANLLAKATLLADSDRPAAVFDQIVGALVKTGQATSREWSGGTPTRRFRLATTVGYDAGWVRRETWNPAGDYALLRAELAVEELT